MLYQKLVRRVAGATAARRHGYEFDVQFVAYRRVDVTGALAMTIDLFRPVANDGVPGTNTQESDNPTIL